MVLHEYMLIADSHGLFTQIQAVNFALEKMAC
jgi:hypothetical protein